MVCIKQTIINMESEIVEFINRRWKDKNETFLNENCYWFAKILTDRFKDLEIFYLPVEGHFVAYDVEDGSMYDANGELSYNGPAISLSEIEEMEPDWYRRLMRDCRQ